MLSQTIAKPLRLFVVEDEILIRMLFEEMLADLGHSVECAASRFEEALELAHGCECDAAILDVHLGGEDIYPVAKVLARRGIPFLFATGMSDAVQPDEFRDRPTMQKPFQAEQLQEILQQLAGH